jgi:hypothetical protein
VRIDQLQKEFDIQVRWIAFPLHPETPDEGLTLEELNEIDFWILSGIQDLALQSLSNLVLAPVII